jgi:hypothetical protein
MATTRADNDAAFVASARSRDRYARPAAVLGCGAGAGGRVYSRLAMISSRAWPVALVIAVALALPGTALARPRVAIVPIDGDASGALQDLIVELLEDEFSIISPRQVTRALDKLELDLEMSAKQLKKLAKELDAESIIRGDLTAKGQRKLLHLRLFHKGKKILGFKVEFVSAKSPKFRDALRAKLIDRLGGEPKKKGKRVEPADESEDDLPIATKTKTKDVKGKAKKPPADEPEEEVPVAKGKDAKNKGKAKKPPADEPENEPVAVKPKSKKAKGKAKVDDDEAGDDEEDPNAGAGKRVSARGEDDDDDEDDEDVAIAVRTSRGGAPGARTANRAAVRIDFGPSMSARSLTFTSRQFEQAPKPYSNSPVPGGRVEGEIYPLAFGNPYSLLSGLGIGGEFDQTVGLNLQSTVQPGTKFPVTQSHWSVGARFRIVIGKQPTSPSVTLGGGYMTRVFKVDRSQLVNGNIIDLPDVGYAGYNVGVELRVPVMRSVALLAGGRGIFVTTTGQIQSAAQYGQARVTGGEGHAGVDIAIGSRMAVRLVGELTQLGFNFTGNGQMANNRDGDPTTIDVGGAADRYVGGTLTFGVMY